MTVTEELTRDVKKVGKLLAKTNNFYMVESLQKLIIILESWKDGRERERNT